MGDGSRTLRAESGQLTLRLALSVAIVIIVTEAIGEAVRPSIDFWLVFAVKAGAGCAAFALIHMTWRLAASPSS